MEKEGLQIPYGVSDFKRIRNEGYYYIDKTGYIPLLERAGSFLFFVRPRRFGKSIMASMLRCYYDVAEKDNFENLFGGLEIARNPTVNRNRYQMFALDFSTVNICEGNTLQERFDNYMRVQILVFLMRYAADYGEDFRRELPDVSGKSLLSAVSGYAKQKGYHLYLMLDEYDNFTNAMIRAEGNNSYHDITHGQGFYREWFKAFKASFDRIYMTGVSPVTMDDVTSGFNIASNISQDADFNAMLGFSEAEVLKLYSDFKGIGKYTVGEPSEWVAAIKPWYDGYCFAEEKRGEESVFNSDMSLYFLDSLVRTGNPPKNMEGSLFTQELVQLKKCEPHLAKIYSPSLMSMKSIFRQVVEKGEIDVPILRQFDFAAIDDQKVFFSLFYYYGVLTFHRYHQGRLYLTYPNECARRQARRMIGILQGD